MTVIGQIARKHTMFLFALTLFVGITLPAYAGFNSILNAIEAEEGISPTYIPFLGLARVVVKVGHPQGILDLRLAIYEDHKLTSPKRFDAAIRRSADGKWHRLVAVWSKKDGERVYVYMREARRRIKLLVVVHDDSDTVVAQIKARPGAIKRFIEDPGGEIGKVARLDHESD